MDEILSLLQRYWWIAGLIILRVVFSVSRKKSNDTSSKQNKPKSQLQEYLEKMKAELEMPAENSPQVLPPEVPFSSSRNNEDDLAYLGHASDQKERQTRLMQKLHKKQKEKNLASQQSLFAPEVSQHAESAGASFFTPSAEKKPFPENLDYLPPLQKAFVFSEVFGPPKGME